MPRRCKHLCLKKVLCVVILAAVVLAMLSSKGYSYDFGNVKVNVLGEAGETYDDNVTYAENNTKKDFITNMTAGLSAKYEGRSSAINLIGRVTQQLFAQHNNYDNIAEDATLTLSGELSKRTRMSLRNVFTHRYEYRSFEEAFGAPGGRYSYFRNRFATDCTIDLSKQMAIIFRYLNNIDLPSRSDISGSYFNSGQAELNYYITSKTIVKGSYDFSIRKFDPGKDAATQAMGGGMRQYLTDQLYFDLNAALDYIVSYDKTKYYKPMLSASLTGDIDKKTIATLAFVKQYYTNAYLQDLFDYWQVSLAFARQLTERLRFSANGFYGNGRYVVQGVQNNLFGASAAIEYELTRRIKTRVSYSFSMTDSDQNSRDYTKNTAYAGLTMEF